MNARHGLRRLFALVPLAYLLATGCNGILGIDPAEHEDAGAGGTSGGGTPCDVYCDTIMTNCQGMQAEYIDRPTCMSMCSHFDPGQPNAEDGNSLACRTYHAGAAAGDPKTHCGHAGPTGNGVCGADPCGGFCLLDIGVCDKLSPYETEFKCNVACKAFVYNNGGDIQQMMGDTLNCRVYHLEAAVTDPTTHCPHTGVVSQPCQ